VLVLGVLVIVVFVLVLVVIMVFVLKVLVLVRLVDLGPGSVKVVRRSEDHGVVVDILLVRGVLGEMHKRLMLMGSGETVGGLVLDGLVVLLGLGLKVLLGVVLLGLILLLGLEVLLGLVLMFGEVLLRLRLEVLLRLLLLVLVIDRLNSGRVGMVVVDLGIGRLDELALGRVLLGSPIARIVVTSRGVRLRNGSATIDIVLVRVLLLDLGVLVRIRRPALVVHDGRGDVLGLVVHRRTRPGLAGGDCAVMRVRLGRFLSR
jgi:hypothetical protein